MIHTLAKASGSRGMVGGQSLDLMAAKGFMDQDQVARIHQLKTGALIVASVQLGALAAPTCDPQIFEQLSDFAAQLGLAYQIQDDIFDYQDYREDKFQPCFVSALGLEKSQQLLDQLRATINDHITAFTPSMIELCRVTQRIAARHY